MDKLNVDPLSMKVIDDIFVKLAVMHPAFRQAWPSQDLLNAAKREWYNVLKENNINDIRLISRGLKRLRLKGSFVPTAHEFCELCYFDHEDIGAPHVKDAYEEACKKSHPAYGSEKNWSHVVVKNARDRTGSFNIYGKSYQFVYKDFARNYTLAIDDYIKNRNLNQIESDQHVTKDKILNDDERYDSQRKKEIAEPYKEINAAEKFFSHMRKSLRG